MRRNDFQESSTTRTPLIYSPQGAYFTLQYHKLFFIMPSAITATDALPWSSTPAKKGKGGRPNKVRGQRKRKVNVSLMRHPIARRGYRAPW